MQKPFPFNKASIEALQPDIGPDGQPKRVTYRFDTAGKDAKDGLIIQVTAAGAKSFYFRSRIGRGRHAKKSNEFIGRWPATTVEQARQRAAELHGEIKVRGVDPVAKRRGEKAKVAQEAASRRTVDQICDAYLEAAKTMPTRLKTVKSETNLAIDRGRIAWHIRPLLGKKVAKDLTKGDVENFRDQVAAGATARTVKGKKRAKHVITGGQGAANRCLNLLGAIMTFAKSRKWIDENPVLGVVKYYRPNIGVRPSDDALRQVGQQLKALEEDCPQAVAILRALALTGRRYAEIVKLRHEWMELSGGLLRIPYLRNKSQREKIVILGKPVIEILAAQPKIADNPYVFPGTRGKTMYQGTTKRWNAIRKKAGVNFRPHDFRHHFSTIATELGYPKPITRALTGHAKEDITDHYIHVAPEALRAAADAISGAIARKLAGDTAKVVQMPQRQQEQA